jgi:hypothetical protein
VQAHACVDAGAAAVVINAEDLMEGAAWDCLLFEAPHSQARGASWMADLS